MAHIVKKTAKGIVEFTTLLKKGDPVMVIAGGNSMKERRQIKGKVGKILRFLPKKNRVIVEGLNMVKRHKRALQAGESSGIVEKEGSIHISNVMYYSEGLKKPVRLKHKVLKDGRKVRGYTNPKTEEFESIDV